MPQRGNVLLSIIAGLRPAECVEFFMTLGAGKYRATMQDAGRTKAKELFVLKYHVEAVRVLMQVGLREEALDAIHRALTAHCDSWDPVHQRLQELREEALDLPGR